LVTGSCLSEDGALNLASAERINLLVGTFETFRPFFGRCQGESGRSADIPCR